MWYYRGECIDNLEKVPTGAVGFIYKITRFDTDRFYIGKKQLFFARKTKITNKEKLESGNNRKKFKTVTKDSGWLNYNSSCKELQDEIKNLGEGRFLKEILEFCFDKRSLFYKEVWWQFKLDVLESNTYNANILSRFFKPKE